jgi:hypothetical protein
MPAAGIIFPGRSDEAGPRDRHRDGEGRAGGEQRDRGWPQQDRRVEIVIEGQPSA